MAKKPKKPVRPTGAAKRPVRAAQSAANGHDTQHAVEQFLYRQAELLDEKRWQDYIDLFAEDGLYIHHLKKTKDGYRIKLQRVDMTNAQAAYDYVLQVWV